MKKEEKFGAATNKMLKEAKKKRIAMNKKDKAKMKKFWAK